MGMPSAATTIQPMRRRCRRTGVDSDQPTIQVDLALPGFPSERHDLPYHELRAILHVSVRHMCCADVTAESKAASLVAAVQTEEAVEQPTWVTRDFLAAAFLRRYR